MSRSCLPLADWPARDRDAWDRALRPGDPFRRGGPAAAWRPATRQLVNVAIGTFARWAGNQIPLGPNHSIADRCTPAAIAAFAEAQLIRVRPTTIHIRLLALRRGLEVMYSDRDWWFLVSMLDDLPATPDVHAKRRRLRPVNDLFALGCRMMTEADDEPIDGELQQAFTYRNGLAIATLALRPLRRRNFAELIVGRHLRRIGDGWWLNIPGKETKTGQPIDLGWPEVLAAALERYLQHWRPVLAGRAKDLTDARNGFLWLSTSGGRLSPHTMACEISAITEESFGAAVNMHLFRDALATNIAINDPEHVRIAAALLGHRQLTTTERHYNLARSVEAAADYHHVLKHLR